MPAGKKKTKEGPLQQENILEAVIIADSFNSRFYPVTAKRPRCLFPLANQPLLSYTLEFLTSCGVKQAYVYCCHCSDQIKEYLAQSKWSKDTSPCAVTTIVSSDFTSVGDVLRDVDEKSLFQGDFLLVPGDVVSNLELKDALNEHRTRREKNKNASLLTMVLQSSSPTHRSRTVENDIVIASNSLTNRVLHYHKFTDKQKKVEFPLGIFQSENTLAEIRYDLSDTGIWVCSALVPELFTDNFDYQTQVDFIKGIISEEISTNEIHMHVPRMGYCARVYNFHTYDVVSHDVITRWAYPHVPEIRFDAGYCSVDSAEKEGYSLLRHCVYLHETCVLGQNSVTEKNVVIGAGTEIGSRCHISDSVIGDGCRIADDCVIKGSYIWNNVIVENRSKISHSFISDGVKIYEDVSLKKGCILCDQVSVGPSIDLESKVIHLFGKEENFENVTEKRPFDMDEVGEKGKGYMWQKKQERDDGGDASISVGLWGLSLHEYNTLVLENKATDDSESTSDDASSITSGGDYDPDELVKSELDFASAIDGDLLCFHTEVRESLQGGYEEKSHCDNLILEINSSKYAYNMAASDVIEGVTSSLLEIAANQVAVNKVKFFTALKQIFLHFVPLLCNYNKTASSQMDCLYALEKYAIAHEPAADCLAKVLMLLYDNDVLSEDAILHWNSNPGSFDGIFTPQQIRQKVEKIIQWLNEAEEEDSDESS